MGDGSSSSILKSLKNEWSLFLQAFQSDENTQDTDKNDPIDSHQNVDDISFEEVRDLTKTLTEDRKKLNQQLEILAKELEQSSDKLENLRLVGGQEEGTLQKIHDLNDLGLSITEQLAKIDKRLRQIRAKDFIQNEI